MTGEKRDRGFREVLEASGALEFIESVEASELDVGNFEIKQRKTHIVVACTPSEENVSEELQAIAAEFGFERKMDAPSLQQFRKETS